MLSLRRPRDPRRPPLERGERVLTSSGDAWATDRALLVQQDDTWARLPWWQVLSASWDDERGALHLEGVDGTHVVPLAEPGLLPEVVRERVQSSIVLSRHVQVQGRLGAQIVARRVPGRDELLWQQVPDPGLDATDPAVRATLDHEQERLRSAAL